MPLICFVFIVTIAGERFEGWESRGGSARVSKFEDVGGGVVEGGSEGGGEGEG